MEQLRLLMPPQPSAGPLPLALDQRLRAQLLDLMAEAVAAVGKGERDHDSKPQDHP